MAASTSRISVSAITAEELKGFQRIQATRISVVTKIVQDIVRHIRRHWRVRTLPKDPRKVIRRTSQVLHYEPTGDEWELKRERQFNNVETAGLFSDPWRSYREVGGVELDTRALVLEHLVPALDLTEEFIRKERGAATPNARRVSRWSVIQSLFNKKPEIPENLDDVTGISTIRESLKLILELYAAIKGKRTFSNVLWELRKKEEEKKAAKPPPTMQAIPLMQYEDPQKMEKEALLRERKIRNFCLKLQGIQHILNSMIHMKDKEIRHKTRLTTEAITRLRTTSELDCPTVVANPNVMDPFGNMKVCPLPKMNTHKAEWIEVSEKVGTKPPLWQNLHNLSPSATGSKSKIPTDNVSAEGTVKYLRSSLFRMLERTRNRHLHQLERLDRELVRRYKYTFLALSVLPLSLLEHTQIYEATLQLEENMLATSEVPDPVSEEEKDFALYMLEEPGPNLQDILNQAADPLKRTYKEAPDVAVWYQLLQEESRRLRIADAERVIQEMKSLVKFNAIGVDHILHAEEKLCMLLMSMSAQDVCTKHWQVAAKFVLEEILEGAEGTIELWMDARGMPIMTV